MDIILEWKNFDDSEVAAKFNGQKWVYAQFVIKINGFHFILQDLTTPDLPTKKKGFLKIPNVPNVQIYRKNIPN